MGECPWKFQVQQLQQEITKWPSTAGKEENVPTESYSVIKKELLMSAKKK